MSGAHRQDHHELEASVVLEVVVGQRLHLVQAPQLLSSFFCPFYISISLSFFSLSLSLYLRLFRNLWFAKPMVCMRVAFHENDGNYENGENDEDNSDSYKQRVECWINGNHENHGNDESRGNQGCKPRVPQTTGLEIPDISPPFSVLHPKVLCWLVSFQLLMFPDFFVPPAFLTMTKHSKSKDPLQVKAYTPFDGLGAEAELCNGTHDMV